MTGPLGFQGDGLQDAGSLTIDYGGWYCGFFPVLISCGWCRSAGATVRQCLGLVAVVGSLPMQVARRWMLSCSDGVSAPSVCERGGVLEMLSNTRPHMTLHTTQLAPAYSTSSRSARAVLGHEGQPVGGPEQSSIDRSCILMLSPSWFGGTSPRSRSRWW